LPSQTKKPALHRKPEKKGLQKGIGHNKYVQTPKRMQKKIRSKAVQCWYIEIWRNSIVHLAQKLNS